MIKVICTFVDEGKFENFLKNNAQGEIAMDTKVLPRTAGELLLSAK